MNEYSQGVADDGAVILKNGEPMTPDEIVRQLRTVERDYEVMNKFREGAEEELRQCQQLLFTVIYALPEHAVELKEADFVNLPYRPTATQANHPEGGFRIEVRSGEER